MISKDTVEEHRSINIYELEHICKEWARDRGYYIRTDRENGKYIAVVWDKNDDSFGESKADIEPETVFILCEDILKDIK